MTATEKGDVDTMTQLFSSKAIQKLGADTIRANNQIFADTAKRAAAGGTYRMEDLQETSIPEGRQVSFFYKNDKGTDSIKLVFVLSKEGGAWKIDSMGGPESEEIKRRCTGHYGTDAHARSFRLHHRRLVRPLSRKQKPLAGKPISGGVLNGKAISLPKPVYPPVARAAKASGIVIVQVVVDENGNVVSARAVSGHPLLQASCVAAARAAKFTPTKLAGQPVKVNGIIQYNSSLRKQTDWDA